MRFRALHDLDLPATCRANRSGCFCARIAAIGVDALYERKAGACLPQQFDGGRISSDGSVLAAGDIRSASWLSNCFARCFPDHRDPLRLAHALADVMRARVTAIACGYEDPSIPKRAYRQGNDSCATWLGGEVSSTTQQSNETSSKPIRQSPALV